MMKSTNTSLDPALEEADGDGSSALSVAEVDASPAANRKDPSSVAAPTGVAWDGGSSVVSPDRDGSLVTPDGNSSVGSPDGNSSVGSPDGKSPAVAPDGEGSAVADSGIEWVFLSFVHRWVDFNDIVGGEQVRPYELFTSLAAAGHEVRIYERHHPQGRRHRAGRLRVRPLQLPSSGLLRRLLFWPVLYAVFVLELLGAKRRKARLCLYQTLPWGAMDWRRLELVPAYVLFRVAGWLGATTWGALQDLPYDHFEYGRTLGEQNEKENTERTIARRAADVQMRQVRHADFVTVVSENMRRTMVERTGIRPNKARVFRSSVNPEQMKDIPRWEPPNGRPWRIGFLGHAADAQLPLLIAAIRLLKNGERVELVLAGNGTPELEADVQGRMSCRGAVQCFGDVQYKDFSRFAREMDLWVIPYGDLDYLHLAWQLKPPMYVASGRPVVMTETDETAHSGLAPYLYLAGTTPASIATRIDEIRRDPEEARRRAQTGRDHLLGAMTWRQTGEHLVECLNDVVSER